MNKSIIILSALLLILACKEKANAQNLVLNPSFEDSTQVYHVSGSPHLYDFSPSSLSLKIMFSQKNIRSTKLQEIVFNMIKPVHGNSILGIGHWADTSDVLALKLADKLQKDSFYELSIFALNNYVHAKNPTKRFVLSVSDKRACGSPLLFSEPNGLSNKKWKRYAVKFRATGAERYVVLGSGASAINLGLGYNNPMFDQVVLQKTTPPKTTLPENVTFDQTSSQLKPEAYPMLDEWVTLLSANPSTVLSITGHTDNQGSEAPNRQLSLDRANAVKAYLLSKGVKPEQMKTQGAAASKPIANNKTEEGRSKNRRVELEF